MIFESHAHYDDEAFLEDRDELLSGMEAHGISHVVNIACSIASTKSSLALAHQYPHVYAAVGIHPEHAEEYSEESMAMIREAGRDPKAVAIGEIGLDYHWPEPGREIQKVCFREQLILARKEHLPVVIHSRDAAQDTLEMIRTVPGGMPERRGVIHCFSYSKEIAEEYIKMGFYIGIGGVVTFDNAKKLQAMVKDTLPLDKILLETDSPYLAPTPHRGKRNCSWYLPLIAEKIAALKEIPVEQVMEVTAQNAKTLFDCK
ncbi:MAG: TatD family hydrolase [Lachnospiraceae bacterium]|nr:TatD family hydrolase [Lachnospiraceae bacterium]